MELVFASNNKHKLEEIKAIAGNAFTIKSLAEAGIHEDLPETSDTLEGNALQKARRVHKLTGKACFADDTGLMVEALDGGPGVYTARYAGPHCSPADNIVKMLKEMQGVENRKARFATVIAFITTDGQEFTFEGAVDGLIATEPSGSEGFGYDPIFIAVETGVPFAEMSAEAKNAISHRGRATQKFMKFLKNEKY